MRNDRPTTEDTESTENGNGRRNGPTATTDGRGCGHDRPTTEDTKGTENGNGARVKGRARACGFSPWDFLLLLPLLNPAFLDYLCLKTLTASLQVPGLDKKERARAKRMIERIRARYARKLKRSSKR